MSAFSFNDIPEIMGVLLEKLNRVETLLENKQPKELKQDHWFDLDGLIEYDPEKRSKATFYGYVHRREIPHHKKGKKLLFLKSEIDEWLKKDRVFTSDEVVENAHLFLKKKGGNNE